MELTKMHRDSLLQSMEGLREELELQHKVLDSFIQKDDIDMGQWSSISVWLIKVQLNAIKKAISNNEIEDL